MNKKEAIIAMLEGKKVRDKFWNSKEYLTMNEYHNFRDESGSAIDLNYLSEEGWEIYQEPKPKKLVELKCCKKSSGGYIFTSGAHALLHKELPYTIKDGKIFVEVE